ncbi:hypothetical protein DIC66_22435 [Rhodoferax lacus]|uniref:DUF3991 domain-containing protein n=1 Tax=Rhodoferax lacus TaxID=2184758 RepID=A0A3E1R5I5_9BURK|nr:DUF3991 and toprim domain-containing protein [Rhodoferax lacus]RFO94638.1 hypothetical protein DIC66_22435 [Rhodoferax lacus]
MALAPVTVDKDLEAIAEAVVSTPQYSECGPGYLTKDRGISAETLRAFQVQKGEYGNALFPHLNKFSQWCGYEVKNRPPKGETHSFTGFSKGGEKGLYFAWQDPEGQEPRRIVITEAAIDLMSYYQLHHATQKDTMYVSTGGSALCPDQEGQLVTLLKAFPDASLVLAMDADPAGDRFAAKVVGLAPVGMKIDRHTPPQHKDWNDYLLASLDDRSIEAA